MILTEEILLLQKRAGIITENERKEKIKEILLEGNAEDFVNDPKILALAAKIVKQPVEKVEDKVEAALAGKEEESKEKINEDLALTLALALPMILEAGGKLSDLIKQKYGLSSEEAQEFQKWETEYKKIKTIVDSYGDPDANLVLTDPKKREKYDQLVTQLARMKEEGNKQFSSDFGEKLREAGHGLHSLYTSPIRALLWVVSKFTSKDNDLRNKEIREKIANIIYATGMVAYGGYGAIDALKNLAGVSEASLAILDGTKAGKSTSEIIADIPVVAKAFAT